MFEELEKINSRPNPFEFYTASDLWADKHTSNICEWVPFSITGEMQDIASSKY